MRLAHVLGIVHALAQALLYTFGVLALLLSWYCSPFPLARGVMKSLLRARGTEEGERKKNCSRARSRELLEKVAYTRARVYKQSGLALLSLQIDRGRERAGEPAGIMKKIFL